MVLIRILKVGSVPPYHGGIARNILSVSGTTAILYGLGSLSETDLWKVNPDSEMPYTFILESLVSLKIC